MLHEPSVSCANLHLHFNQKCGSKLKNKNSRFITISMAVKIDTRESFNHPRYTISHNHINHFTEMKNKTSRFCCWLQHRCIELQCYMNCCHHPTPPPCYLPHSFNGNICVRLCDEKLNIDYLVQKSCPPPPATAIVWAQLNMKKCWDHHYFSVSFEEINLNSCISSIDRMETSSGKIFVIFKSTLKVSWELAWVIQMVLTDSLNAIHQKLLQLLFRTFGIWNKKH